MLRECPAYGQCCYCYEHNQMGCSPYVPNYKNMYHFCALFIYAALKDIMKYTLASLFSQAQSSNKVFIQQLLPSQSIKKLPKLRNHFKTLTVYCHYSKIRNVFLQVQYQLLSRSCFRAKSQRYHHTHEEGAATSWPGGGAIRSLTISTGNCNSFSGNALSLRFAISCS